MDAAIALATKLGKSIQTWNPAGGTAHGPDVAGCAKAVHSAIALGNDTRYTFQPSFRGMGDPGKVTAEDYANTIGSFLLARGESALLEFPPTASPGDIYPNATQFPWSPLVDKDYGVPLGLAMENGNGIFKREWSKATIYFDCHKNDSARFVFKTDDGSSDGATQPSLVTVFPSADAGASCYRIPMMVWSSNKTKNALLAFAEARRSSHLCSDAGPKGVAMRRSWDGGFTWEPVLFIHNDSSTPDSSAGFNFGMVVHDNQTGCTHLHFVWTPSWPRGPDAATTNFEMKTCDVGETWTPARNISQALRAAGVWHFGPGEASGLQAPDGTLLVTGFFNYMTPGSAGGALSLLSTDHGDTWKIGGYLNNTKSDTPNECEPAALPDGSLILAARDEAAPYRVLSRSHDFGRSWEPISRPESLHSAICQGSILWVEELDRLLLSFPAGESGAGKSPSRSNLVVKASVNGESWQEWKTVFKGDAAYSVLQSVPAGATSQLPHGGVLVLFERGHSGTGDLSVQIYPFPSKKTQR